MEINQDKQVLIKADLSKERLYVDKEGHLCKKEKPNMGGRIVSWFKHLFIEKEKYSSEAIASKLVDIISTHGREFDQSTISQLKGKVKSLNNQSHSKAAKQFFQLAYGMLEKGEEK